MEIGFNSFGQYDTKAPFKWYHPIQFCGIQCSVNGSEEHKSTKNSTIYYTWVIS